MCGVETGNEASEVNMIVLTLLWRQLWHLVYLLAGVCGVRHAETEVKVKGFEEVVAEVVPLYHPEMAHGLVPNSELNPKCGGRGIN